MLIRKVKRMQQWDVIEQSTFKKRFSHFLKRNTWTCMIYHFLLYKIWAKLNRRREYSKSIIINWKLLTIVQRFSIRELDRTKVLNIIPYRYTNQLSLQYAPSCPEYTDTWYTKVSRCTTHTGPLSDQCILPVLSGTIWYYKLWIEHN